MTLEIKVLIEAVVLCFAFWGLCAFQTGGDKKNIASFYSYPDEVQAIVREREDLNGMIGKQVPWYTSMIVNVISFSIVLFLFAVWIRQPEFVTNFFIVLILGEVLNAFDFLVMDLLWWRNTKRIRFSGTEDNARIYKGVKKHFFAFLRGIICFLLVALIVGGIITAF